MCKFTTIILLTITLFLFSTNALSQNIDLDILKSINNTTQTVEFSKIISNTTTVTSLGMPAVMGIAALIEKDDELLKNSLYIGFSIGVNGVLTYGLKHSIQRTRPYVDVNNGIINQNPADPTASTLSFPSGHTSMAFATATALSLKYPKWYVIVPGYLWAGSVGYSRMNLGVHYPSDVLAGALLGAGSAFVNYKINNWFWKKQDNKKPIGLQAYL